MMMNRKQYIKEQIEECKIKSSFYFKGKIAYMNQVNPNEHLFFLNNALLLPDSFITYKYFDDYFKDVKFLENGNYMGTVIKQVELKIKFKGLPLIVFVSSILNKVEHCYIEDGKEAYTSIFPWEDRFEVLKEILLSVVDNQNYKKEIEKDMYLVLNKKEENK